MPAQEDFIHSCHLAQEFAKILHDENGHIRHYRLLANTTSSAVDLCRKHKLGTRLFQAVVKDVAYIAKVWLAECERVPAEGEETHELHTKEHLETVGDALLFLQTQPFATPSRALLERLVAVREYIADTAPHGLLANLLKPKRRTPARPLPAPGQN